jgi:colicin import membrane protein
MDHVGTQDITVSVSEKWDKGLVYSLCAHGIIALMLIVKSVFWESPVIDYQSAVRVDLVGLPDKLSPKDLAPAAEKIEPVDKSTSGGIEEISTPSKPTLVKKLTKEPEAVNLSKTADPSKTQNDAINKLKALNAIDKIKAEVNSLEKSKTKTMNVKGNIISPGTSLTGLSRLQMDDYQGQLDIHVKKHWYVPEWLAKKKFMAIARVFVDETGIVIGKKIEKASGNASFDESVLSTIDSSSPFPPPPEKFSAKAKYEGILFEFGSAE